MKYNVEVLKKMVDVETANIEMFSKYENVEERLALMVANRRYLCALIENDGVVDDNFKTTNSWIGVDSMAYSACAGADTSRWTKGT